MLDNPPSSGTLWYRCMREGLLFFAWGEFCCYKWVQRWIRGMAIGGPTRAEPVIPSASSHIQLCTKWSRKHPLKLLEPSGEENASHSHILLNEPNYSRTNKESWHTVFQALTCHVYICSESICTPDSTHIYFSSELPTFTPYPELAITMPGSSSLPHTSVSRATKWNLVLSCTNWGWKYFLMPKINLNTFQCSS